VKEEKCYLYDTHYNDQSNSWKKKESFVDMKDGEEITTQIF
jgi:hypothetical protein